jgi:protein TonB
VTTAVAVDPLPASGTTDRLGVTLLFSLIAHAVLILGVTFGYQRMAPHLPTLDVILVQSANAGKPDKADFLAQANNRGGGDSEHAARPTDPLSGPLPIAATGIAPQPMRDAAPQPQAPRNDELLTRERSDYAIRTATSAPDDPKIETPVTRAELQRQMEIARLTAERDSRTENYAKRPKRKFISANTREYALAEYMRHWVDKVERIGNLNYPDEARRRQLHGQLVLTVGLNRDGSIKSVDIIQSSGHRVLDDAAQRIVRLAAPFPPVPQDKEAIDELYVTRTWQFLPGDILRNR